MSAKPTIVVLLGVGFVVFGTAVEKTEMLTNSVAKSDGAFKDNGDGTVSDTNTNLMWQRDDDSRQRNWKILPPTVVVYLSGAIQIGGYPL